MKIERSEWRWQGSPGHCIVGDRCVWHLNTVVGPWLVSTIGEYYPDGTRNPMRPIGAGRNYETMVMRAEACPPEHAAECGESHIDSGECVDFAAAQTRVEAERNHNELCERWAECCVDQGRRAPPLRGLLR